MFLKLKNKADHVVPEDQSRGGGQSVADEISEEIELLDPEVKAAIKFGLTDTPSCNQKAWKLLERKYPGTLWMNCMTHEISLFFGECISEVEHITTLFKSGVRVVKWVNNHSEILRLFRACVVQHFEDKRRHSIGLYMPGATRMASVFRMLNRLLVLKSVLQDLVSTAAYTKAAQAAIKDHNSRQEEDKRIEVDEHGVYEDWIKDCMQNEGFWNQVEACIGAFTPAMHLLRLTDGTAPVMGKIYYSCALLDKSFRLAGELGTTTHMKQVHAIFLKRCVCVCH